MGAPHRVKLRQQHRDGEQGFLAEPPIRGREESGRPRSLQLIGQVRSQALELGNGPFDQGGGVVRPGGGTEVTVAVNLYSSQDFGKRPGGAYLSATGRLLEDSGRYECGVAAVRVVERRTLGPRLSWRPARCAIEPADADHGNAELQHGEDAGAFPG
jgi:hypothetical protein